MRTLNAICIDHEENCIVYEIHGITNFSEYSYPSQYWLNQLLFILMLGV